jgi:hypothetical protein
MNSDLITRWTAIMTNIALVIGLVFVGLEFRNNSLAVEAERVDGFVGGIGEVTTTMVESEGLSELLYQSYADPESLSGARLDRTQNLLMLQYNNFRRVYLNHESGLLPDDIYKFEVTAVGFAFSSDIGLDLIALFRASTLSGETWDIISDSAEQARAYCLNPKNVCVARYEAARKNSG